MLISSLGWMVGAIHIQGIMCLMAFVGAMVFAVMSSSPMGNDNIYHLVCVSLAMCRGCEGGILLCGHMWFV